MTVTQPKADVTEIKRALDVLFQPGDVVELRALDVGGKVHAGYFNDFDRLANEAARLSGQAAGVYVVLNQVNRELLARAQNRITVGPKNLTQDADITRRHWLPIDVDAKRPSGISSTDQEHAAAIATAKAIKGYLIELGFPADSILTGDSGNGAYVLVRIDLPNDAESKYPRLKSGLYGESRGPGHPAPAIPPRLEVGVSSQEFYEATMKACLKAIAAKFDSSQVSIDLSVYNAARIWKLPGTLARKGDNTTDRPHRIAKFLEVPENIEIAPRETLGKLVATLPTPEYQTVPQAYTRTQFNLSTWLLEHGIVIKSQSAYDGGTRYIPQHCPFNLEHTGTSVAFFQGADGRLGFKCHHNGCAGKTWADVREFLEPGYKKAPTLTLIVTLVTLIRGDMGGTHSKT